jgi:hypothetical protein
LKFESKFASADFSLDFTGGRSHVEDLPSANSRRRRALWA